MAHGVRWLPDDNARWQRFDSSTRYISHIGSRGLPGNVDSVNLGKSFGAGFQPMIIPRQTYYTSPVSDEHGYFSTWWINNPTLDSAGNLHYEKHSKTTSKDYVPITRDIASVDAFAIAPAQRGTGRPGVWAADGADFAGIDDSSMIGFVAWRGTVNVSPTWGIPQEVLRYGPNYVVFARWTNGETLGLNRNENRLETYNGWQSVNNTIGGSCNGVQVVICVCGAVPDLPYANPGQRPVGFVIRNQAGQTTFSSRYPAIQWRGGYYRFEQKISYDSNQREQLERKYPQPANVTALPMVPLCSIGLQRIDVTGSSGAFKTARGCHAAFRMYGDNGLSVSRGSVYDIGMGGSGGGVLTIDPTVLITAITLPCIDAADYF